MLPHKNNTDTSGALTLKSAEFLLSKCKDGEEKQNSIILLMTEALRCISDVELVRYLLSQMTEDSKKHLLENKEIFKTLEAAVIQGNPRSREIMKCFFSLYEEGSKQKERILNTFVYKVIVDHQNDANKHAGLELILDEWMTSSEKKRFFEERCDSLLQHTTRKGKLWATEFLLTHYYAGQVREEKVISLIVSILLDSNITLLRALFWGVTGSNKDQTRIVKQFFSICLRRSQSDYDFLVSYVNTAVIEKNTQALNNLLCESIDEVSKKNILKTLSDLLGKVEGVKIPVWGHILLGFAAEQRDLPAMLTFLYGMEASECQKAIRILSETTSQLIHTDSLSEKSINNRGFSIKVLKVPTILHLLNAHIPETDLLFGYLTSSGKEVLRSKGFSDMALRNFELTLDDIKAICREYDAKSKKDSTDLDSDVLAQAILERSTSKIVAAALMKDCSTKDSKESRVPDEEILLWKWKHYQVTLPRVLLRSVRIRSQANSVSTQTQSAHLK